ncbi:MAG: PEGA domain-containing protein [Pseudomonadota bacterium]
MRTCTFVSCFLICASVHAQSAPATSSASVFVVEPKLVNIALESLTATIAERAANSLAEQGLQVLTKDDVREVIAHATDLQILGSDADQGSLAALGQAVGTPYLLATVVSAVDDDTLVQMRLIETAKAAVLCRREVKASEHGGSLVDAVTAAARLVSAPVFGSMRGTLHLTVSEEGANILIDGEQIGVSPLPPTPIAGGYHVVAATAQGFIKQQETIHVQGDEVIARTFTLRPSPEFAREWRDTYGLYRTIAWVGTGLAVPLALAGAGLGAFWVYRSQVSDPALYSAVQDEVERDLLQPTDPRYRELDASRTDAANTTAIVGSSGLVAGSLLLVSGGIALYFWLFGEDPERFAAFE